MLIDDDSFFNTVNPFVQVKHRVTERVFSHTSALHALRELDGAVAANSSVRFPDAIPLDLCMSQMVGRELLERYGQYPQQYGEKAGVYPLTSSIMAYDRERADKNPLGGGYIEKPFTQFGLEQIVSRGKPEKHERMLAIKVANEVKTLSR